MLACDTREAWTQFLAFVKSRTSTAAFGNWIEPIRAIEADDESLTLEVPNIFVQEYLLTNYKKDLTSFLPVRADGAPAIQFVITTPKREAYEAPKVDVAPSAKAEEAPQHSNFYEVKLNSRYRFDSFIEGTTNQFIKSAAMGVARRPGESYNPFFIHGGVGLGKTHTLHSIGHYIAENHKGLKVQLITTEGYINDLVENLKRKTNDRMKHYYRSDVDVLLIDDIQFLQNRTNFEEEFCILLEHYANNGKQVVITSDKPPSQLKLSERMKARMEWGLVAHMGVPDLETRVAILTNKAEQKSLPLSNELAFFIAERLNSNVRQLEGAINRLSAHCRLLGVAVTKELIINTLGEAFQGTPKERVTVEQILKSVAAVFQVRVSDLKGTARLKVVATPRQVAMYLAKNLVNDSLMSLGVYFNKTHSTILHACKAIEERIKEDEKLRRQLDMVERHLENPTM